MLHSEPSFSIYNNETDNHHNKKPEENNEGEELIRPVLSFADLIDANNTNRDFSFQNKNMGLMEEEGNDDDDDDDKEDTKKLDGINNGVESSKIEEEEILKEPASPPMYLAAGLGIHCNFFFGDGDGSGIGDDLSFPIFDGCGKGGDVEEYYQRMVDEYPCHPLLLSNYGQLLQSKGDLCGAEDYYHRATLANPGDGQNLCRYAKLIWELHHDKDIASPYFERAVLAAPQDSQIVAAYASFLWEADYDDDNEDDKLIIEHTQNQNAESLNKFDNLFTVEPLQLSPALEIDVLDHAASDIDESYKRLIEDNPSNPLVLRNYAHFLHHSKGDLQAAEEYYAQAIQADPADSESMSQYAKLIWELHQDRNKATSYFEQSIQATPGDSCILAAYASFLWEINEEEEQENYH